MVGEGKRQEVGCQEALTRGIYAEVPVCHLREVWASKMGVTLPRESCRLAFSGCAGSGTLAVRRGWVVVGGGRLGLKQGGVC
jgi:hypothetical protein